MPPRKPSNQSKKVETIKHEESKRRNIPTAEHQSVMAEDEKSPIRIAYDRRNRDLDPQLVWRGKDEQDWSDLVVSAPPLYIQEKVHPKAIIEDLVNSDQWLVNSGKKLATIHSPLATQLDLFADFNGLPKDATATEFYQHDANWTNRMILGDSLQVMASLAEREGLRGKVQCIYFDPPYGIKFNSNFQWSTTSRDVKDGKLDQITREPEQVKAFRDTWRDGIHSYLTYLRDRLTVARDLLTDSGSIFVQIGDENVHRVRALMDEVFGEENFVSVISFQKTSYTTADFMPNLFDQILLYAKQIENVKYRKLYQERYFDSEDDFESRDLASAGAGASTFDFEFEGKSFHPGTNRHWKTPKQGLIRAAKADRFFKAKNSLRYKRYNRDFSVTEFHNTWTDTIVGSFHEARRYVVETSPKVVQRCLLMTTDPGDLVLDPTCGSGTTAYVAEQWGRRWITIDTSRVALALARARIMGARYPYYLLADSPEGQQKEAEISGKWKVNSGQQLTTNHSSLTTHNNIRLGFVYDRVPHITLKSIANNTEIDTIWESYQTKLEPLREELNRVLSEEWEVDSKGVDSKKSKSKLTTNNSPLTTNHTPLEEWEIPREIPSHWPLSTHQLHRDWWKNRIARQKEIDASIAAKADQEFLYDKPYEDKNTVRVAGPFTVESLSPHRVLAVDENDDLVDSDQWRVDSKTSDLTTKNSPLSTTQTTNHFVNVILENLKTSGVQQAHKEDKINFTSLVPFPGQYICAEGTFEVNSEEWLVASGVVAGEKLGVDSKKFDLTTKNSPLTTTQTTNHSSLTTKRAGIFIGSEFGTVSRPDLVAAAREAGDIGFDVLIACAFNYDAHSAEFNKLGRIPILKARMNADLHMANDLKNTGAGNLFVIFGEPDILVASEEWLVDSLGVMVAPYEIFKLVSGVNSLAEINRLSREDLLNYTKLSCRREIWDYITNAASSNIDSSKYSGGASTADNWRISSVSWHCARLSSGSRNISDFIRQANLSNQSGFRELITKLRGDQQDAKRTHEISGEVNSKKVNSDQGLVNSKKSDLSTNNYPLSTSLTTNHYSQITIYGVDVFHPQSGEVRSSNADEIACWFIDTDYNEESFFVRHAYFLGASDPYKSLKTTLKAEIDEEAWSSLYSDTSRPFAKPKSGRIAVKVINHLGDEVMKVFSVG